MSNQISRSLLTALAVPGIAAGTVIGSGGEVSLVSKYGEPTYIASPHSAVLRSYLDAELMAKLAVHIIDQTVATTTSTAVKLESTYRPQVR
jgi:hypothetical protein